MTTITLPAIAECEFHAGLILKEDGTPDYLLIGLPGELEAATWKDAMAWANEQGGDLPTRRELNLLRANARQHFKDEWYWSNESYASGPAFAWYQHFYHGGQDGTRKYDGLRARAVRRLPI